MVTGFVTLTCVMDIYRRKIRSSRIANALDVSFWVHGYTEAVRLYGAQVLFGTFVLAVATSAAKRRLDGNDAWSDNMFIERFWR